MKKTTILPRTHIKQQNQMKRRTDRLKAKAAKIQKAKEQGVK